MPDWEVVLADSAAVLLIIFILLAAGLVIRRRLLGRGGGLFELSLNDSRSGRQGWTLGLGRYSGEQLEWFRTFSLSLRCKRSFARGRLLVERRRAPEGTEAFAIFTGHVIVECESPDGPVQLAMSEQSLTGFLSWSESSPPGRDTSVVV